MARRVASSAVTAGIGGFALFILFVILAVFGLAITTFGVWVGLNLIGGFGLSFWQLVGIAVAGGSIVGSNNLEVKTS